MGKPSFKYLVAACIVAVATICLIGCAAFQSGKADAETYRDMTKSNGAVIFDNVSDRPMTKKDLAEKKAIEDEKAKKLAEEKRIAAEKEAARIAEEKRLEEEKAAQQAAAEEAERKAREAAGPQISYTPGEGDYADVLMVGDSIMVVSKWSIESYLPGVTVDACSARSLETGGVAEGGGPNDGVLDHIRALDPNQFSRYVIGTGNNDWNGMDLESGEEIVSCLAGKQIYFVTEYVTNNTSGTDNTNATIDELCAKYPNVHKIDWYTVASANRDAFLGGDNCHPQNQDATDTYAGLVKAALDSR